MQRIYTTLIQNHFKQYSQMALISGARQVGKTTISKESVQTCAYEYLNWDNLAHKDLILRLFSDNSYLSHKNVLSRNDYFIILDEIHKFPHWKNAVKGLYDTYKDSVRFLITGSAKLDIYRKGGDSMMGRYFNYTIHPLTVAEIAYVDLPNTEVRNPYDIKDAYEALFKFGGYPEAFLKQTDRFHKIWNDMRFDQLFRNDIRDLEDIRNVGQLETLARVIQQQSGNMLVYSNLATKLQVSQVSIKNWVALLESFYFCFRIKPWSQNISRSIIKEPKIYLWDWSIIEDEGARFENFIALHLLKAVNFWNEIGMGYYGLYYLRTKEQKEVDFVLTKNNQPWILVEAKLSNNGAISKNLFYFQERTKAPFAFQVIHNMDYIEKSCFNNNNPIIVPARTFLSQLI